MDDIERCTSYLDGTLDAEERAALEAELAGDAELRALLAGLERAERALGALEPTPLPAGARERLDAALAQVVDEALTHDPPATDAVAVAPTTAEASGRAVDELAQRRRRRPVVATTAGVAAGLALLAGGVIGIGQLMPERSGDQAMTQADTSEVLPEEERALSGTEAAPPGDLPVVIDEGRTTTATGEDAQGPLGDPVLQALAQRRLPPEDGVRLAEEVQRRVLGAAVTAGLATTQDPEGGGGADGEQGAAPDGDAAQRDEAQGDVEPLMTRDGRVLDPASSEDVRRCLTELLDPGQQAIPATIELVTIDGEDAAIFGLLSRDPDGDIFTRIEAWTLTLDACQVLRFDQS